MTRGPDYAGMSALVGRAGWERPQPHRREYRRDEGGVVSEVALYRRGGMVEAHWTGRGAFAGGHARLGGCVAEEATATRLARIVLMEAETFHRAAVGEADRIAAFWRLLDPERRGWTATAGTPVARALTERLAEPPTDEGHLLLFLSGHGGAAPSSLTGTVRTPRAIGVRVDITLPEEPAAWRSRRQALPALQATAAFGTHAATAPWCTASWPVASGAAPGAAPITDAAGRLDPAAAATAVGGWLDAVVAPATARLRLHQRTVAPHWRAALRALAARGMAAGRGGGAVNWCRADGTTVRFAGEPGLEQLRCIVQRGDGGLTPRLLVATAWGWCDDPVVAASWRELPDRLAAALT